MLHLLGPREELQRSSRCHSFDEGLAEGDRLIRIPLDELTHVLAAVGQAGEAAENQRTLLVAGADADRGVTARVEAGNSSPLGGQLDQRIAVGEAGRCARRGSVAGAALEGERSLPGSGHELVEAEGEGDLTLASESAQPGGSEDDPVELAVGQAAQPRVDVAPELDQLEVGSERQELRAPAQARRSHACSAGNLGQRRAPPEPGVSGILAHRHADDLEARGQLTGNVLGAVDGELDLAGEQRPLDLADESGLVVEGGGSGGARGALVARRADRDELGVADRLGDRSRLRQGERAAASTDPQAQSERPSTPRGRSGVTSAPLPSGSVEESRPKRSRRAATCW